MDTYQFAILLSLTEYPDVIETKEFKTEKEACKYLNKLKAKYPNDDIAYRKIT